VFDNLGIRNGIATELGTFVGIGEDAVTRKQLIQVTSSFTVPGTETSPRGHVWPGRRFQLAAL
jgi:hypothetical protein